MRTMLRQLGYPETLLPQQYTPKWLTQVVAFSNENWVIPLLNALKLEVGWVPALNRNVAV